MRVLNVVLIEGEELDQETFAKLTGLHIACGCFRCGRRIAVHVGQLAGAHMLFKSKPTMIFACTECKDDAVSQRIGGDGSDAQGKFPDIEFNLGD